MIKLYALIFISLVAFTSTATAGFGKKIKDFGHWSIYRNIDPMSSAISCLGILDNNPNIQLTKNNLFLRVNGNPEGYQIRVNNQKASKMVVQPYLMISHLGIIEIANRNFIRVLEGKRLRVLVVTYQGNDNIDINLSKISSAENFMLRSNECN